MKYSYVAFKMGVYHYSLRAFINFGVAPTAEHKESLNSLKGAIDDIEKQASELGYEENPGDMRKEAEDEVAPYIEVWSLKEPNERDAYVASVEEDINAMLSSVEEAFNSKDVEAEESEEETVSAEDVEYTRLYTSLLRMCFELGRIEASISGDIREVEAYEEMPYDDMANNAFQDIMYFVPEWKDVLKQAPVFSKTIQEKYFDGELPEVYMMEVMLFAMAPETEDDAKTMLAELDKALVDGHATEDSYREYSTILADGKTKVEVSFSGV